MVGLAVVMVVVLVPAKLKTSLGGSMALSSFVSLWKFLFSAQSNRLFMTGLSLGLSDFCWSMIDIEEFNGFSSTKLFLLELSIG